MPIRSACRNATAGCSPSSGEITPKNADPMDGLERAINWNLSLSLRATASVYLSPRSGRHIHSEAVEPRSGGTPRKRKEQSEPRRQERAAASHGVGRKPGDGKVWYQYIASLSVTPTCVGVPVSFWVVRVVPPATLTRDALHHSLWICRPDGLRIPLAFGSPISNLSGCGGFFQNVVGVSIAYKIFGRRVRRSHMCPKVKKKRSTNSH